MPICGNLNAKLWFLHYGFTLISSSNTLFLENLNKSPEKTITYYLFKNEKLKKKLNTMT